MVSFADLLYSKTTGKVLSQKAQNKDQSVAGIRDNDIREDGMGMFIAVTENAQYTKVRFFLLSCPEINDRTAIVVVNVAVTDASTAGTGLTFWPEFSHIGIKKIF